MGDWSVEICWAIKENKNRNVHFHTKWAVFRVAVVSGEWNLGNLYYVYFCGLNFIQ